MCPFIRTNWSRRLRPVQGVKEDGPLAASREKIFSRLHTKDLLGLWLCRFVEGDVVDIPTEPILFLWSEQKV